MLISPSFLELFPIYDPSFSHDPPLLSAIILNRWQQKWQSLIEYTRFGDSSTFHERLLSSFDSKYQEWISKIDDLEDKMKPEQFELMMIKLRIQWNQVIFPRLPLSSFLYTCFFK